MNNVRDAVASAINGAMQVSLPRSRRVVTFGEAVVRLTPPDKERFERATSLDVSVGGPELNVAVALSSLGNDPVWVSALPDAPLGRLVLRAARANGIDVSHVRLVDDGEARVGLRLVEEAPEPRPSMVHEDVAGSAMARLGAGVFDWEQILEGAAALHVSGVTLGLSAGARAEVSEAIRVANQRGVLISFDLTYHPGSWGEADARQAFMRVIPEVDVLFCSRGGLRTFFGIEGSYESVLRQSIEKLGVAAVTLNRRRAKGSRRLVLESMAMGKSGVLATSGSRDIEVVSLFGAADAYAGGFLTGYLENPLGLSRAVSIGAAAAALTCTMPGEFLCATRDEVEELIPE